MSVLLYRNLYVVQYVCACVCVCVCVHMCMCVSVWVLLCMFCVWVFARSWVEGNSWGEWRRWEREGAGRGTMGRGGDRRRRGDEEKGRW